MQAELHAFGEQLEGGVQDQRSDHAVQRAAADAVAQALAQQVAQAADLPLRVRDALAPDLHAATNAFNA